MPRKPLMTGWCGAPSETNGENSHDRCKGYNTANPDKEWQPCPCPCHLGEEFLCGNCGRVIAEAPLWVADADPDDPVYTHVVGGRGIGEDCPPGGKPHVIEPEPEIDEVVPETIDVEIEAPSKPKKKGKKKGKKKSKKKDKAGPAVSENSEAA